MAESRFAVNAHANLVRTYPLTVDRLRFAGAGDLVDLVAIASRRSSSASVALRIRSDRFSPCSSAAVIRSNVPSGIHTMANCSYRFFLPMRFFLYRLLTGGITYISYTGKPDLGHSQRKRENAMILRKNLSDNAYLVSMTKRARCCGDCGQWLDVGALAWSYLPDPVDGNYVECGLCRYGVAPDLNNHGEAIRLVCY
jgi:hypothetical protein